MRSNVLPANAFWWIVPSGLRSKKQSSSFSSSRALGRLLAEEPREVLFREPAAAVRRCPLRSFVRRALLAQDDARAMAQRAHGGGRDGQRVEPAGTGPGSTI
jgi:hypothetical protein